MKKMMGCCGINCEQCDAYLATLHNDDDLRVKTAQLWSKLNHTSITPEMINCTGCRTEGVKTFFCSNLCQIRQCVQNRGFETCADCAELNGCKTVALIHTHKPEALENLRRSK